MELRHLRAFVAVAEERNLTKAAERLHICQPPLSRQIHQLEDEVGARLFVRRHDGVELTPIGRTLLPRARAIVTNTAEFLKVPSGHAESEAGVVRVGFAWGLWEVVNRVRKHHTRRCASVVVEAEALTSHRQNEAVSRGGLDVAFLRSPVTSVALDSMPLFEERFVVLLAERHRLAKRKTLRIRDLEKETLLLYPRDGRSGVYDKTLALYARAGVVPTVRETPHSTADHAATIPVACGKGIFLALSSPLTQSHEAGGIAVVPLNEPEASVSVNAAWRRDERSLAVTRFVQSIRDTFRAKELK